MLLSQTPMLGPSLYHTNLWTNRGPTEIRNSGRAGRRSGQSGTDRRQNEKTPVKTESYRGVPKCTDVQVTPTGLEPDSVNAYGAETSGNHPTPGGAESGVNLALSDETPADLRVVVDSWTHLSEAERRRVLAIVRKAATRHE